MIGEEWNDLPLQNALHKLGWISYEWNKLDEALAHASRSGELAERMGAPLHLSQVPALRAQIHAVEGRWDDAFDDIEQAISASIAAGFSHVVPELEEMKCRMWLATDQLTLAQSWLQRVGLDIVQSDRFREVSLALTALRVQMHDGRFAETIGPLERLRRRATAQGWIRALISIQTLRAISESAIGNAATAQAALNEALDLGMTEGFVRTYIDEGPRMVPLLQQVANSEGPRQAYATSLLVAAGAAPPPIATPASQEPSILSPRERDVMKLVASGLSNRDVGDALFISEETVKTHMRRIFEKLEVSSRTQAINRSQQLGLL